MGVPLYITFCCSLAAFNILSLWLVFVSLISMCLGIFLLGFILYGTLCASWTWLNISFPMLSKFSTIISSKFFWCSFFSSSSSGTPIIQILVHLILSQRSLRLFSVLFILFTLFCSSEVIFIILSSSSLICSPASEILLLIPSRVFFYINILSFSFVQKFIQHYYFRISHHQWQLFVVSVCIFNCQIHGDPCIGPNILTASSSYAPVLLIYI